MVESYIALALTSRCNFNGLPVVFVITCRYHEILFFYFSSVDFLTNVHSMVYNVCTEYGFGLN